MFERQPGWYRVGITTARTRRSIYVLTGGLRMEFGPAGARTVEAGPGDFVYVAPGAIHRESYPTEVESQIVVVRSGTGDPVVNADGPEQAQS